MLNVMEERRRNWSILKTIPLDVLEKVKNLPYAEANKILEGFSFQEAVALVFFRRYMNARVIYND